jgi:Uma2 family endonuclease
LLSSAEQGYRMHMATKTHRWTSADLARMPDDGNRYEVLDGELFVTPMAEYHHQRVAGKLFGRLLEYCERYSIAEVVGPGAVRWAENELQPDVEVIPGDHDGTGRPKWQHLPRPILVVEVLSDSSHQRDRWKKREAYARRGIPTYWIVDPDERCVTVWSFPAAEPQVVTDILRWQPRADLPPLEIPLAPIFGGSSPA